MCFKTKQTWSILVLSLLKAYDNVISSSYLSGDIVFYGMTTSQRYIESKPAGKLTTCSQNAWIVCHCSICWYTLLLLLSCFTNKQLGLLTWSGRHQLCQRSSKAALAAVLEHRTVGTPVLAPQHLTAQKVVTFACSSPACCMYYVTLFWVLYTSYWVPVCALYDPSKVL